jgi:ribosome-binding factor A
MEPIPQSERQRKINQELTHLLALFINENSNRQSLITITRCLTSPDLSQATAYISVIPEDQEATAEGFLNRRARDAYDFIKSRTQLRRIPRVSFVIDMGEKNRQRIDQILREVEEE